VTSSAIGSVLESMPGSVLENVLGVYLEGSWELTWEHKSSRLGVRHREQLGAYSQAGWDCAIESNWEHIVKQLGVCNRVHSGVYFRA
jgi:hypothetical protein